MDVQVRIGKHRTIPIQDQENIYVGKGKIDVVLPTKRQGLSVRGELNSNVQIPRDTNIGKVALATVEFEKKATKGVLRSNYSHVQSRVDTGLAAKNIVQPSSRPPLRREESTGALATRAIVTRAVLKDTTNKQNDPKESALLKARKYNVDIKKSSKLPTLKENPKETKNALKPILKESTESLRKLKVADNSEKQTVPKSKEIPPAVQPTLQRKPSLPADIEDIDANDKNSPMLISIYIKDIYKYLTQLEEKYPIEADYLKKQTSITGKMRATLIDWLVEVHHQFSLVMETFQLTIGIIDRYLQVVPNVQRTQLQLVGVTAMFIASKYEEIYAPDISDFIYVTDYAYSKEDVFRCEREIMTKLDFCLARPIPLSFLRRFIKAAHGTSKNHHLAKYFVDLSLVEYSMVHYRPSELAAAAICLSLYLLSSKSMSEVWTPTLSYYSGYSLKHIEPIIRQIAKIVVNVDNSKYKAVYKKYLDNTLAKVASLPQLKSEALQDLASISS